MTDSFEIEKYAIVSSLNERNIYIKVIDEISLQTYENNIDINELNIPFDKAYIEYLGNISEELGALIMQLKNQYQRARPYQYALYGNQKLNPYTTFSGNTPSYPSGHACSIYFIGKILCFHYEEKEEEINKLISQVIESRIILGLHFKSDNNFGLEIAKTLLEKEDIKKKYFDEND